MNVIFSPCIVADEGWYKVFLRPSSYLGSPHFPVAAYVSIDDAAKALKFLVDTYRVNATEDNAVVTTMCNGAMTDITTVSRGAKDVFTLVTIDDEIADALNAYMAGTSAYDDHNLVVGGVNSDA